MEYKELIDTLKSILPKKAPYGDLIGAEGLYAHSGPLVYEYPEPYFIEQAITAITELSEKVEQLKKENAELLKRAEQAEEERYTEKNRKSEEICWEWEGTRTFVTSCFSYLGWLIPRKNEGGIAIYG